MRPTLVLFLLGLICSLSYAQATVSPGFWVNSTLSDLLLAKLPDGGVQFDFRYELIPVENSAYHFQLTLEFREIFSYYELELSGTSTAIPTIVEKEKGQVSVVVFHTKKDGAVNSYPENILSCGVVRGVVRADAPLKSVKSALYLTKFDSPTEDCGSDSWPTPLPIPEPEPTDVHRHHGMWPSIVAGLISFFTTIGVFFAIVCCVCVSCRLCCGRKFCRSRCSRQTQTTYPAEKAAEPEVETPTVAEYAPVATEEPQVLSYPYIIPMPAYMAEGQNQYLQLQPVTYYPQYTSQQ
jgi:hypothetical protein